ncbi:Septin-domain-containing protein [Melanogaster broomeanus]|nr:Septin-domain-containing protein [Melanogaster broomeanus]
MHVVSTASCISALPLRACEPNVAKLALKPHLARRWSTSWTSRDSTVLQHPGRHVPDSNTFVLREPWPKARQWLVGDPSRAKSPYEPLSSPVIRVRVHGSIQVICDPGNRNAPPPTRPTGHSLCAIDVIVMKKLSEVVNVVPVIAKADSLTLEERTAFKQKIRAGLVYNNTRMYPFDTDDNDDKEVQLNESICNIIPFAVVSSEHGVIIDGKSVHGRKNRWGVVNVEETSSFSSLVVSQGFVGHSHVTSSTHINNSFGGIGNRLSIAGIFGTIFGRKKDGHNELLKRLFELGHFNDEVVNEIFALLVGVTVEVSLALTNVVNLLLDVDKYAAIHTQDKSADAKDLNALEAYVVEALRIDPPFTGVYGVAKKDAAVGSLVVTQGERLFLDVAGACMNPASYLRVDVAHKVIGARPYAQGYRASPPGHSLHRQRPPHGVCIFRSLSLLSSVMSAISRTFSSRFSSKSQAMKRASDDVNESVLSAALDAVEHAGAIDDRKMLASSKESCRSTPSLTFLLC